jgi:hypothetical protein
MAKDMSKILDCIRHQTHWKITRYADEEAFRKGKHYSISEFDGNCLLNEGIAEMHLLMFSTGGTAWSNANAYLGVGDSATAEAASQTGLQASTNKLWKAMEATYPTYASQVTTWRSVFGSSDANFAWNEFTVVNASTDTGDNLLRKVSAQGTKASGQVWTLDLAVTWS